MHRFARSALFGIGLATLPLVVACSNDDNPYKPVPAWSGKRPSLPAPPSLPNTPVKSGDAYSIYGAIHQLRSLIHSKEVTAQPITIVGYVVDSNIPRAPDCAVHKTGKKDPDNCAPEVPSFWIADNKGDTKGPKIRVVGWARNFAVIYDAMTAYKKLKPGQEPPDGGVTDDMLNVVVPFPLPSVGEKVRVTGAYNVAKVVVSDMVSEPIGGVIAYSKIEQVEPAPEPAAFAKKIP
ncbi:MAG: hypothetical protein M3O46_05720 [Myxococcota bacterium]|nr:hypothetical protein [Myxococcota bacterium]